jgi:hypothetical protein
MPTICPILRLLTSFCVLISSACTVFSQNNTDDYFSKKATAEPLTTTFITEASGINANLGLLGVGVEFPLAKKLTNETGIGISSWGLKVNSELRFYLNENYEKGSIGIGYSLHSGGDQITQTLETDPFKQEEEVTMDFLPLSTINATLNHAWRLGKRKQHKFVFQTGYAFRITDPYYKVTSGHTLSPFSKRLVSVLAPGGMTLALAFSFGL